MIFSVYVPMVLWWETAVFTLSYWGRELKVVPPGSARVQCIQKISGAVPCLIMYVSEAIAASVRCSISSCEAPPSPKVRVQLFAP